VPVTISVHGAVLTGKLIAQSRYFSELVEGNPLMSALEPGSGLLGKEYTKEAEDESDHHLHVRAAGIRGDREAAEGLWRISLGSVDGWALRAVAGRDVEDDRGPFARLLGTP
jgi:DNA-binding GntR family transcriptional regulator